MYKIILEKFPTHIAKTNNKFAPNKMIKLNNQAIYNGALNRFARNIVMTNLHNYVIKEIKTDLQPPLETFPLWLVIEIHTVKNHGSISMRKGKICWKAPELDYKPNWDIENLASIWVKAINDSLTMCGIIPDDNIEYINQISYKFVKVKNLDDRKIVIKIK